VGENIFSPNLPEMEQSSSHQRGSAEKEPVKKLHIGCGKRFLPGYVHVDAYPGAHIDVVCDLRALAEHFPPASVSEIYACHVLEHFGRHEVAGLMAEWARLLQPGGVMRIAVPDLEAVFEHYATHRDLPVLTGLLYGGQTTPLDYHQIGFTFDTLRQLLERAGLEGVARYDWRSFLPAGADDYSRSYLPHLAFDTGKLMSLNIVATKPL
jgi:predicted SAM-dependent methyltransferase